MGPSARRIAELGPRLAALGHSVVDKGDLRHPVRETRAPDRSQKKYTAEIARVCRQLYKTATAALTDDATPAVIGGDHSLAAGSVDAHADMNTPSTTDSGNIHGMPLAALLGAEPAELAGIGAVTPAIRPDRVTRRALALILRGNADLHVSFDLDVCDPAIAPGMGTPVRGGLSYRETHMLMELVADTGRVRALDLVEVNPVLDTHNMTAQLGVELALSAFG